MTVNACGRVKVAVSRTYDWFTAKDIQRAVPGVDRATVAVLICRMVTRGYLEREAKHPKKTGRIPGTTQRYRWTGGETVIGTEDSSAMEPASGFRSAAQKGI